MLTLVARSPGHAHRCFAANPQPAGPARLPYAMLGMIPAEAMGLAMMASDTAWQTAAAVMMAGSVTTGLIGLASTWSWLTAEVGEGRAGG